MSDPEQTGPSREPVALVAPTTLRARGAVRALGGRWGEAGLVPVSLDAVLRRRAAAEVLLCPEGRNVDADLAFLRRARARILWPAPDADLHAAIAGLRGEHVTFPGPFRAGPREEERKSALLLEGTITLRRARMALASESRHWIVETPLAVRLTYRQLEELSRRGVRWSALAPVRLVALLASPAMARARRRWRHLLPRGTKVRVWRKDVGGRT